MDLNAIQTQMLLYHHQGLRIHLAGKELVGPLTAFLRGGFSSVSSLHVVALVFGQVIRLSTTLRRRRRRT